MPELIFRYRPGPVLVRAFAETGPASTDRLEAMYLHTGPGSQPERVRHGPRLGLVPAHPLGPRGSKPLSSISAS
jgi:hypothetical protein